MALQVAFLRGMNLGGRRIKNEQLRAEFERLGFERVATFRASGNVVFDGGQANQATLTGRIEAGLGAALGYEVPVYLRSAREVAAIAAAEPFEAAALTASTGKVQVQLVAVEPAAAARRAVLAHATDEDRLALVGRELYWLPSGGISESDLDLKAIDAILGAGTMRTKGTIEQIAAKHCE
ncbi:MAG: DUF1697 domain-containing protein [Solirubrobacterales bacterium]